VKINIVLTIFFYLFIFNSSIFAQRKGIGGALKDTVVLAIEKFPVIRGDLPKVHSLVELMPKIKSQRDIGSCVSWSTVYGAMSIVKRIENADYEETPFSPIRAHSAYKFYYDSICRDFLNKKGSDNFLTKFYCRLSDCTGGAYTIELLERLKEHGCSKMSFSENQYLCTNQPHFDTYFSDKIYDFSEVDASKAEDLKKALLQNSPIVIVIDYYALRCWADDQYFIDGVWDGKNEGLYSGSHAMLLVGYDDKKEGGAFQIVNSWGDDFGQNGTFWIKYADAGKIDRAYRIILDPSKNKDIKNIGYPSGQINGSELESGEYEALFSSKNNFAFITGSGTSSQLLDVKNKKTIDLAGLTNLDYSNDKRCLVGLSENAKKIVLLSNLEENQLSSKDFNYAKLGVKNKMEFSLPKDLIVKSVHVHSKGWNNEIKDFRQVAIVSKDNRAFIWFPNSGKFIEVLKPSLFSKKNKTKHLFYNPYMGSFILIKDNNEVLRYDLEYALKTRYQKDFLNFEINNYISLAYEDVFFANDDVAMEVRLGQTTKKSLRNFIKQKIFLERKRPFISSIELNKPLTTGLYTSGVTYYSTENEVYIWYAHRNHDTLNLNASTSIEKMMVYQKENSLLIKTKNSIFVYDLNKKSVLKEYKNINAMLGVSEDGILIAKDLFNKLITIDLKWLY